MNRRGILIGIDDDVAYAFAGTLVRVGILGLNDVIGT